MTLDPLSAAIQAYRSELTADGVNAPAVRSRVLAELAQGQSGRAARGWLLLPLAVVLFGSVAFGAVSPSLHRTFRAALDRLAGEQVGPHAPNAAATTATGMVPRTPSVPESTLLDSPEASARVVEPGLVQAARVSPGAKAVAGSTLRRALPSASVAPSPGASQAETAPLSASASDLDRDLALYQVAHRLHFGGAPQEKALAAWRAYLDAFPNGVLAVEARYNLTVCLLKAGHEKEAERELEAIADGRRASYRRPEARRILTTLRARRASTDEAASRDDHTSSRRH